EGYEVTEARSGEEALKKIEGGNFDLLLLDIMMPDMSGWDLFTRISKLEKTYAVVFLTVLEATKERLKIIKEYGVADYITKPFDRDDFVKRIAGALKK
ncbi:MAG: response regulator, partial [bacterium]|nr:response regulator [bacterium]